MRFSSLGIALNATCRFASLLSAFTEMTQECVIKFDQSSLSHPVSRTFRLHVCFPLITRRKLSSKLQQTSTSPTTHHHLPPPHIHINHGIPLPLPRRVRRRPDLPRAIRHHGARPRSRRRPAGRLPLPRTGRARCRRRPLRHRNRQYPLRQRQL